MRPSQLGDRRHFLGTVLASGLAAGSASRSAGRAADESAGRRRFTMDLTPGAIGVSGPLPEIIRLAHAHGFESVAPDVGYLTGLDEPGRKDLLDDLKANDLVWGAAGLPVEFRKDADSFRAGLEALPKQAAALEKAGVQRVGTWLRPSHEELTYLANFKQHVGRLREVAKILGDHGLRFGLEYVSPKTSWTAARHPFVHSMAEARELIAEIGRPNVGLVLDSWHWYNAAEDTQAILQLSNSDIVACDLNDAPAGIPREQQMDLKRELPRATGVIDLKAFLNALVRVGYDGPVRAEPFKAELRSMPADRAVATTAAAMKQAFALIG